MCWHAHLKCVCEFKKKKEKENTHTKKKELTVMKVIERSWSGAHCGGKAQIKRR